MTFDEALKIMRITGKMIWHSYNDPEYPSIDKISFYLTPELLDSDKWEINNDEEKAE